MGCSNSNSVKVNDQHPNSTPAAPLSFKTTTEERKVNDAVKRSLTSSVNQPVDKADPNYQLIEQLKILKKSALSKKQDFEQSFEILQTILKNIVKDFSNEKFKSIKKENKKFNILIAKFKNSSELMKLLGFQDRDTEYVFIESLPKSFAQMKILDLNIAHNKLS